MRALFRKFKSDRGQALVEIALALPVLLLLFWGIVEFGRMGHAYLTVTHAAREGARLGAVGQGDEVIEEEIERRITGLSRDQVVIEIDPPAGERYSGESLEVEVKYDLDFYLPIPGGTLPESHPVRGSSVMRVE